MGGGGGGRGGRAALLNERGARGPGGFRGAAAARGRGQGRDRASRRQGGTGRGTPRRGALVLGSALRPASSLKRLRAEPSRIPERDGRGRPQAGWRALG